MRIAQAEYRISGSGSTLAPEGATANKYTKVRWTICLFTESIGRYQTLVLNFPELPLCLIAQFLLLPLLQEVMESPRAVNKRFAENAISIALAQGQSAHAKQPIKSIFNYAASGIVTKWLLLFSRWLNRLVYPSIR